MFVYEWIYLTSILFHTILVFLRCPKLAQCFVTQTAVTLSNVPLILTNQYSLVANVEYVRRYFKFLLFTVSV